MTLAEALGIARRSGPASRSRRISLVCGFEPLHLKTFLHGYFGKRFPDESAEIVTGLYGDLEGNLAAASAQGSEGVAVVLEWSDIDPRLGLRSAGGWGLSVQPDIIQCCCDRFTRLLAGLADAAAKRSVALVAPTLPIPLLSHAAGCQLSPNELELERQLSSFLSAAAKIARVSVLNPAALNESSPPESRLAPAMELKAGFPYSLWHASALAAQLIQILFPPSPLKGLITDLDGVMWAGIVGEVGPDSVKWGLGDKAQVHALYQQMLRHLSEMGVLLAVASKNELAVAETALQRRDMLIPQAAFYPICADWGAKSRHVERILRTWNIGAESVVFVDDSELELAEVQSAFPSITCLWFPEKSPSDALALLRRLRDLFGKPTIQKEDRLRQGNIRSAEALRVAAQGPGDPGFLKGLQGRIALERLSDQDSRRPLELINKTNQFNLNGIRLSDAEWLALLDDPASLVLSVAYEDKFGPLGVISVLAGKRTGAGLNLSSWVMSCRAFSRRIEFHVLDRLFGIEGVENITLDFQPTDRNKPLQEFFLTLGVEAASSGASLSRKAFLRGNHALPHEVSLTGDLAQERNPTGASNR